jgi:hypothetical protein
MSYGLQVKNGSGLDLIDTSSQQVQVVKEGTVTPGSLNNQSSYQRSQAPSVICPGRKEDTLLFCRPKLRSGYSLGGINPNFAVMWGQGRYTLRPSTTVSSGNSTFNCTVTFTNIGLYDVGSYVNPRDPAAPTPNPVIDLVGQTVSGWNSSFSGYTPPTIKSVSLVSGTTYSITFSTTTSSTMYASASTNVNMDVASFVEQGSNWYWNYRFQLDYRFGRMTDGVDESTNYGLEVYASDGETIRFSSNRKNFQIENITSGNADFAPATLSTGELASGSPVIYTELQDVLNWEDYWVLVTGSGYAAAICDGYGGSYNTGQIITWGVGFSWCLPGNNSCENKAISNNPSGGPSSTSLVHSSQFAVAICPMYMTLNTPAPAIGYGGGRVQDDWVANATRCLITGKFI